MVVEFTDGCVVELEEYSCVLERMEGRELQRVREWQRIVFHEWDDIELVVEMITEVIEAELQDAPGDDWLHSWQDRWVEYSDERRPYVYNYWLETGTDTRSLHLTEICSVWSIIHEMAHLMDVPRYVREEFNADDEDWDHGESFCVYLRLIADAVERTIISDIAAIGWKRLERVGL